MTGCARLAASFRGGVHARCTRPGCVILTAQLTIPPKCATLLVHWEVTRDARLQTLERYGLVVVQPPGDVRIKLEGLELGRTYRYRFWAGGRWSRVGRFRTMSHERRRELDPLARDPAEVIPPAPDDLLPELPEAWVPTFCFS